jgi:hypothetical protein
MREERKINKKILIALAMVALMTLPIIQVLGINPNSKAPTNGVGKSKNDHLYLFQKDSDEEWEIVDDPKWAKINFNNKQNKYVLNAHGLTPNEDFELICYLDPWPGDYSVLLGAGTSDEEGNLHIQDYVNVTELHEIAQTKLESAEYQENPDAAVLADGQKIWLVPAADFDEDAQVMIGWNPDDILFEFDLLNQEPID